MTSFSWCHFGDHKLAKSRNFGSPRRKKFKNIQYFYKTKLGGYDSVV